MAERFQYPIWAAIDPEALGEQPAPEVVTLDEFQAFSVPVLPSHQTRLGWFATDPETLGDPLDDKLEWFQRLSEPLRGIDRLIEAGNIFVDEPPVVVTDELEWFQALSHPEPLPSWRQPEWLFIDPVALGGIIAGPPKHEGLLRNVGRFLK